MSKKTHEEYVAELAEKNPDIEVIGRYVNAKTNIEHHCLIHDVYWDARPDNILHGNGCSECRSNKISNFHSKSNDEYVLQLKEKNPNVIPLEGYINNKTPILHKCLIHDVEWKTTPSNALLGHGCSECRKQKISGKKYKSHEQYVEELRFINPYIIAIEEYAGAHTPILHKCLKDGYVWSTSPHSILIGNGCPMCANRIRRTHDEYVNAVKDINNNIEVTGEFVNTHTETSHKCLICGYEWEAKPCNILIGNGCPNCAGNIKKSHDEYVHEISLLNPDIEVIGIYINAKTPILHRCKIDGCEWYAAPTNVLDGRGCPRCGESSGERMIRQWLDKNNILYEYQKSFLDCRDKKPLPFDFYLPEYNICVEYDGEQHYKSVDYFGGEEAFQKRVKHDKVKTEYCYKNSIRLLRIPYFANVEEELNNFLFI